jgi:hypothetical protein
MTKWEYCYLIFAPKESGGEGLSWRRETQILIAKAPEAERLHSTGDDKLSPALAELGSEGWELVGFNEIPRAQHLFVFKRPSEA